LLWNLGAFFAALLRFAPQKTGLSAPIFAPSEQKFRFYPLRGQNRFAVLPYGVSLRETPGIAASAPAGLCYKGIDCTTPLCG
jgi:hypothetical protein